MNIWEAGITEPLLRFMKNPAEVPPIQDMYECYTKDPNILKTLEKNLLGDARFKELYESWYTPKPFTIDELLVLPENSFGHIYATHMKKNNLELNFISPFKGKDILSYIWLRAGHVHDITHVITGYDTSFLGELGVKGFELAQYLSPATAGILGSGLMAITAIQPELVGPIFDKIIEGYTLSKRFPILMGIKWDQEWKATVPELKAKYKIP